MRAIDNISLKIPTGTSLVILGPSGSGKTTLLRLIAGLEVPDSGEIYINGELASCKGRTIPPHKRNIGFIFQDFELLDYLSVMDNILHPFRITPALKLDRLVRKRAAELAGEMGIADKLKRNAGRLSQGEKQRAAICRALLTEPGLILADEATGNLDPENKEKILDLLFRSLDSRGATLLAVTHDHELLPHFDRVSDFKQFRTHSSA